ncbi:hypothetical protein OG762_45560 [Streptomyces sp. NBC_01136]|uniref:hypothetical protein n=1 Tax=unclassified Streptomyces TaxID=2593676 RepID=UPI003249794A|nr:hypothetical protein OG762_45560 [Streptomyces sp. NBC_01136]
MAFPPLSAADGDEGVLPAHAPAAAADAPATVADRQLSRFLRPDALVAPHLTQSPRFPAPAP